MYLEEFIDDDYMEYAETRIPRRYWKVEFEDFKEYMGKRTDPKVEACNKLQTLLRNPDPFLKSGRSVLLLGPEDFNFTFALSLIAKVFHKKIDEVSEVIDPLTDEPLENILRYFSSFELSDIPFQSGSEKNMEIKIRIGKISTIVVDNINDCLPRGLVGRTYIADLLRRRSNNLLPNVVASSLNIQRIGQEFGQHFSTFLLEDFSIINFN